MDKIPTRGELTRLIGEIRDLPEGTLRRAREDGLLALIPPDCDIGNLLKSDAPSEVVADICLGLVSGPWAKRRLSPSELLQLTTEIMEGPVRPEAVQRLMVALFAFNCSHPAGADLIYYPDEHFGSDQDVTPEMVVAKALGT